MFKNIQALRALAAILVVFVHLNALLATAHIPMFGGPGVDLFFVISGFVMVQSTKAEPPSAVDFAKRRIARVVPIYWVMTAGVFSIAVLKPDLLGATKPNVVQLIKSLLFIPFRKSNGLVDPILFLGWTLNYEMFFYALFALGLSLKNYMVGLALVCSVLGGLILVGAVTRPTGVLEHFYTSPIMFEFAFGIGAGLVVDAAPRVAPQGVKLLMLLSLLAFPLLFAGPFIWPSAPYLLVSGGMATVLVLGAALLERWGMYCKSALLLSIGDASYILYLSHPYITQIFQKIGLMLHTAGTASLAIVAGCIIVVIASALVLHAVLERPLWRWARARLSA